MTTTDEAAPVRAEQPVSREPHILVEVARTTVEADGVLSVELRSAGGEDLPTWEPGAHVDLVITDRLVRQYSLSGRPGDPTWRLGVLLEPQGRGGSRYVHETLAVGDRLVVRGPRNNFPLDDAERYLFIAGGIGITPILPMVRQAAARGVPWQLLYGGRSRSSMAFVDEVLAVPGGTVRICPQDEVGLLDLDAYLSSPQDGDLVYCCGPGPLLDAVAAQCATRPTGSLRVERFTTGSERRSPDDEFTVIVRGSGRRVLVPQYVPMLDALEDAGYVIENSCRAGICGTCLTTVVSGIPEHNDDVLSDEERDSNAVILPCVSRSKTDILVVEL